MPGRTWLRNVSEQLQGPALAPRLTTPVQSRDKLLVGGEQGAYHVTSLGQGSISEGHSESEVPLSGLNGGPQGICRLQGKWRSPALWPPGPRRKRPSPPSRERALRDVLLTPLNSPPRAWMPRGDQRIKTQLVDQRVGSEDPERRAITRPSTGKIRMERW